jgi:peroxiredoxin Q/BCP
MIVIVVVDVIADAVILRNKIMLKTKQVQLTEGQLAVDFELPDQDGNLHKLSNYRGNWILLYFYPKDHTPGCTKEACNIRDHFPDFRKLKALVFGISVDSVESHRKFSQKYKLPFTLLSDSKKEVVKKYGVWVKKNFLGKTFWGTARTSFLISPEFKIVKVYKNVKPENHAKEVLTDLHELIKKK